MAKQKISGRVSKVAKETLQKQNIDAGELQQAMREAIVDADLDKLVQNETRKILDPQKAKQRENEIRDLYFTATKKTKGLYSGILMGLFGDNLGQAAANVLAKAAPDDIQRAEDELKKLNSKYKIEKVTKTKKVSGPVVGERNNTITQKGEKKKTTRNVFEGVDLDKIIKEQTKDILDPAEAKKKENQIRDLYSTATKKTKGLKTGIFQGLFGDEVGQALANKFAKEDPKKILEAQDFFKQFQKDKKEKSKKTKAESSNKDQPVTQEILEKVLKKGFKFDPRIGKVGGYRNLETGKVASEKEALARKERTDRLSRAIGADEEPLVLLRERFDELVKSVGVDTTGKTIHEKLDDLVNQVEGGGGFGLGDLLGLGGLGRRGGGGTGKKGKSGGARGKGKVGALRKFIGGGATGGVGAKPRDAKGRFTKGAGGGGFGMRGLLAGGVGAAAGGYLGYKAVDMFRDEGLSQYDPEVLKQEAIAAREVGDTEYTEALKTQIGLQKKDVALRAGAEVAGVAGAGLGAVAGVKVAQKVATTAPAKNVGQTIAKKAAPAAKVVKNKVWDLFVKFIQKRAPKLAAKVGTRLAAAGAMATVPIAGWVGAIVSLGFAAATAYDLYQLWKEFSALSDAEKETAASGKPSKEVNNWAYSVFIGKAKIEDVPDTYREQVEEILKKPPANWKKPESKTAGDGGATEKPKESAKPQTLAGAAAAGAAMGEKAAAGKPSGGGATATPPPSGPAAAIQAAKEPAAAAGGGGGGGISTPPVSKGPERRLGPAAVSRGKVDSGAAKNAALAAASKYGITGPHLAQFMAQLDHESGGFKTVEENLRYSAKRLMEIFPKYYKDPAQAEADAYSPIAIANRVYANRMGNGPPESGDGYKYRGRGLIQLTGKDNYKRFGQLAGVDLVSNPDMAGSLGTAADIAAAFYKKNVIDRGIAGEDTAKVTKAINGGSIGLSHRESLFASYSKDPNALKAGPEAAPSAGGSEPEPSMVAKGQDMKIGGGGGGGAPEEKKQDQMVAAAAGGAAAKPAVSGSASVTPALGGASAATAMPVASTSGGATAIQTANINTANIKTLNAANMTPKQDSLGATATKESAQYTSNQTQMQAAPPPVVVNNTSGGSSQPVTPPKQPMPKASTRSTENAFNRALARDFSHPSAFTSVAPI